MRGGINAAVRVPSRREKARTAEMLFERDDRVPPERDCMELLRLLLRLMLPMPASSSSELTSPARLWRSALRLVRRRRPMPGGGGRGGEYKTAAAVRVG